MLTKNSGTVGKPSILQQVGIEINGMRMTHTVCNTDLHRFYFRSK